MPYRIYVATFLILFLLTGSGLAAEPRIITLMTHDSFSVSKEVVAVFEKTHDAKIRFLKAGDAGAALNKAILSKNNPMADLFFGVDNTFLSRAIQADIFEAYASPRLTDIPDELKLDGESRLLPVDYGDVCLNYDIQWFRDHDLSPPSDLSQLTAPAYKGLTVVENPATSSPGLAFLLATVGAFGEEGYTAFWKKMKQNDVLVSDGWEAAYWGHFSAASEGNRPIVVSYASSPPAEVHFAEQPLAAAPTAAVIAPGTCFRQIEFVGILKGTKDRDLAEKLVDFMLERQFQEDIPLQMFVFPANRTAVLPEVFVTYAKTAEAPVAVDPERIAAMREQWVEGWGAAVLR